ncbi:leucine-rich repeat and fibronectin type III domain-containing protein 1-like protein [Metopolophium dirhodum]|uniref:leucine-rich repeat and fibronectin type III domain-containing protein 1-like protein n=1 Tax=Metopolophium dirhodum TaxID=44670 RepID=UPI00299064E4|nr:leucine-rich repeat and fibronectin type III domain-containing protein 1-like protein [Metopolophium dirhodum]
MHKKHIKNLDYFGLLCLMVCICISESKAQCPWQTDQSSAELQSSCICSTNMAQELSVQCDLVNYEVLMQTLDKYSQGTLDLLYINNSSVKTIEDSSFANLKIHNLQLSGCQIQTISPTAFKGLELHLRHLSLQDNKIDEIPNLEGLINLTLLDLSRNRISRVPDDVFASLKNLQTIKLADNNLTLSKNAFRGLENSLKNLNLKGTNQKYLPECIRNLKNLAFLDLAQNILSELPGTSGHIFQGLGALTALNLERNVIQSLGEFTFDGVKNTLSSLSLLNNLLTDYPTIAISKLPELRVLDLGFNLIKEIPNDAFLANPSLTLLALDGNPIETIPKKAFTHLNTTLRGLSLGGRYLQCDCRIRWVIEWIKNGDLQVTSRERNPQFCASPSFLKNKHFYKIDPSEMVCDTEQSSSDASVMLESIIEEDDVDSQHPIGTGVGYASPTIVSPEIFPTSKNKFKKNPPIAEVEVVKNTNTSELLGIIETTRAIPSTTESTTVAIETTTKYFVQNTTNSKPMSTSRKPNLVITRPQSVQTSQKPPLILGNYPKKQVQEVIIRSVHRQDNSVIIQWDSETANILGFRVVYRLFGDRTFKQGPPLETSEREFKIKNVPYQECIIVCVISLEEITITPDTVPYSQCREIRTAVTMTSNMDRITIAASAAICGTVLIAVVVFIAASKRRAKKLQTLHNSVASCHPNKSGIPVGTLPASCYAGPNAAQMSSLAALNAFNSHKDWDQGSVYSNRSLNPSRMYRVADSRQGLNEDLHSNISNFSAKPPKMRSVADGQSQNSFSNNSMRYLGGNNAYASDLVNSRPELRQSRQSLAVSERMSHISYPGSGRTNTSRNKPRQRSRTREGTQNRPPSRYSHTGSHHTLNNYCGGDTSDNWTDHDMDIYMTRNPTARNGLVPL